MPPRTFARAAIAIAAGLLALPASAGAVAQILPGQGGLADLDARTGKIAPTAAQKQAVQDLGARVQWNRFGTPASLIATRASSAPPRAVTPSRSRAASCATHASLFKLTASGVDALELVNDSRLVQSNAHAVLFRQRFGSLRARTTARSPSASAAAASPTCPRRPPAPGRARRRHPEPTAAWLRAAANAGVNAVAADLKGVHTSDGWTEFAVAGLATPVVPGSKDAIGQRARLVALPTPGGVRAAFETVVLDVDGGRARAYRSFVDARKAPC